MTFVTELLGVGCVPGTGDFDGNGTVEFADFLVLSANFGQTVGGAQPVPEPTGLVSLITASLALGFLRRRCRR